MTVPPFPWRRLSRGIMLVGLGGFMLLTTLGSIRWVFWLEALRYWPVLLIGLGVRMIFERSRAPWGILLSPLIILGTLSWVALSPTGAWADEWEAVSVDRPPEIRKVRLDGSLVFADVDLSARPLGEGALMDGRRSGRHRGSVRLRSRAGEAVLRIDRGWPSWPVPDPGWGRNRWDLSVADDLPIGADLQTAFVRARLDLSRSDVSRVALEGAFTDLTLTLGVPESSVRITLEGAFNRLRIVVPEGTPVSVDTDGPFSVVRGRPDAIRRRGPGYQVRVDGAFNSVSVRSTPSRISGTDVPLKGPGREVAGARALAASSSRALP